MVEEIKIMADEDIITHAIYIRDLIKHDEFTKALWNELLDMLEVERALTLYDMGKGEKNSNIRNLKGEVVDKEVVPLGKTDYDKMSGKIAGLDWIKEEVDNLIKFANEEEEKIKLGEEK